ncbi:MAG: hypothetical protein QOJ12_70 [Thermoleophilales bacterium]|jgi:glycosyltransferase involved in cell wall biosynthesis|nr:hypothetical protein [Thermoleophilales bacterium]
MKIVFVHGSPYGFGGIETWLARFTNRLVADGHEVALLTRPFGEDWDETSAIVDDIARNATVHMGARRWFGQGSGKTPSLREADVLFACNLDSLLRAAAVQPQLARAPRLIAGVFHPREYTAPRSPFKRRWVQHVSRRIVLDLPVENFVFCGDVVARDTGKALARDLSRSPVLPLAIDMDRFRPPPDRPVDRTKIASVARLTPYYTHHRQMVRVIRDLRDRGHDFSYHVYGDGPERQSLEDEVRRLGVDHAVFLHGTVPYDRLGEAVTDAFACIGTGTALLESAACGVPALVAIDSHRGPATYGFIQNTTGTDIGGYVPGQPEYDIAQRLLWLAGLGEDEYRRVANGSRARAEEFSLDRLVPRFVDMLGAAHPVPLSVSASDRAIGQLDWLLEAVLLNLGAPDLMMQRYVRPC